MHEAGELAKHPESVGWVAVGETFCMMMAKSAQGKCMRKVSIKSFFFHTTMAMTALKLQFKKQIVQYFTNWRY